jgi:uncharacterized tellurite resistance protein B-like protein
MLGSLKHWLAGLLPADGVAAADPGALRLAAAVMLVEVMRADLERDARERAAVVGALRRVFALGADDAARLLELAEEGARQASDLFGFTERIDRAFDMQAKLELVELMWRVAYADGALGAEERHIVWRIADLLHVPPGALQHARLRARDGQAPGLDAPA